MSVTIDGTNGITTPEVDSTGPVAGTTGTFSGAVQASGVTTNLYPLVSDTAKTATGTSVDFTGIPSWAKRITVMLQGVSTNGTSNIICRIGAGSVDATSYVGSYSGIVTGTTAVTALSTGFILTGSVTAATNQNGILILANVNSNTWSAFSSVGRDDGVNGLSGGAKVLSGTLDRVRITTVNGTDTFDAGTINILYE